MKRTCTKCTEEKEIDEFPFYNRAKGLRRHECDACHKVRMNGHYRANYDHRLNNARERYRRNPSVVWTLERRTKAYRLANERNARNRGKVFDMYGAECVACGETEPSFLTLDHINNDGGALRKASYREIGTPLWLDIVRNGKRHDLEVLCFNCNFGKQRNGGILVKDRRVSERCND